ncbi:hypothetical protein [Labrys neptuniae]|uniref:Uncharacterized protein n=1 Tax=Labrys neptuniae TaxID=376174 RepID=A0ABV3PGR5_9HYPH
MSTHDHLRALVDDGELVLFDRRRRRRFVRRVWLYKSVARRLDEGLADRDGDEYGVWLGLSTSIQHFCEGGAVVDSHLMAPARATKRNGSPGLGVWKLQYKGFPEARLIGGFIVPGDFIGLVAASRADLAGHYNEAIDMCCELWLKLFPTFNRCSTSIESLCVEASNGN